MLVKTQGSFINNAQLFHLLANVSQITFFQKNNSTTDIDRKEQTGSRVK